MKVLYISDDLSNPIGSPQKVGKFIFEGICYNDSIIPIYLSDINLCKGIKCKPLKINKRIPLVNFFFYNLFYKKYIYYLCKKYNPDIIHIHSYDGYAPKLPENYPCLITFHDESFTNIIIKDKIPIINRLLHIIMNNIRKKIRSKILSNKYYYHSISSNMTKKLLKCKIKEDRIFTLPFPRIYNEMPNIRKNLNLKLTINEKKFNVVIIGLIYELKGIHTVVKAVLDLDDSDIVLYIVGKPAKIIGRFYVHYLHRLIKRAESKSNIIFTGFLSSEEVSYILSKSDCLISASFSEGCQLTTLEAAQFSIPMICSDVGAVKDLFDDQIYYFNAGDNSRLSQLILKLKRNKFNSIKGRLETKYKIQTYSEFMDSIFLIYESILKNKDKK